MVGRHSIDDYQGDSAERASEEPKSEKFAALESCRGICALLVALVHLSANGYFYNLLPVRNGGLGVTYFFVLSGFVMMHAYGRKLSSIDDLVPFAVRRIGRLYPLHIAMLLALFLLECVKLIIVSRSTLAAGVPAFSGANSYSALLGGVLLINGLGFFRDFTWNGPSWTISTELWTYLIFFVVVMRKNSAPLIALLLVAGSGAALALNEALGAPLKTIRGQGAILCVYCFFIGVLSHSMVRPRFPSLGTNRFIEIFSAAAACATFFDVIPMKTILNPLIFALLVIVLSGKSSRCARILDKRPLVYLGKISYSIYMVHFAVGTVLNAAARVIQAKTSTQILKQGVGESGFLIDTGHRWQMDALALVYLFIVIAIAGLTYRTIEVPFRDKLNRFSARLEAKRRAQAAGAV
ncbi:acyltransferase [Sphingomonas sp. BIUV-7]|uniref:Acyltransferase n=1 Tax=Sphingomonas natans TaxID=3063330 RepID=A0ABT8YCN2_9SPHN|nr:acyltransferase [Sphingomonas sp. BIUV-7]MDO6416081.1 acyltransferase [Sphingomonas sp. BIUV-7]